MRAFAVAWICLTFACSGEHLDFNASVLNEVTFLAGSDEIQLEVLVPHGYQRDGMGVRGKYIGSLGFTRGREPIGIYLDVTWLPVNVSPELRAEIRGSTPGQEPRRVCPGPAWNPDTRVVQLPLAYARGQDGSESAICMDFQNVRRRFWRPAAYRIRTIIPVGRDWLVECRISPPSAKDGWYEEASQWSRADLDSMMRTCASMKVAGVVKPPPPSLIPSSAAVEYEKALRREYVDRKRARDPR